LIAPFRNYDHVAALWQHEQWLPNAAVQEARAHYAGFMVRRQDGLRIISLNTNLCTYFVLFVLFEELMAHMVI
jgi:hypothetical protein